MGWHPKAVDYSKWPGPTPEKLLAALQADRNMLQSHGYDAELGLLESARSAVDMVKKLLGERQPDCVLSGANVRTVPECVGLFVQLADTLHKLVPAAKPCFNTGPIDSVEAVQYKLPSAANFPARAAKDTTSKFLPVQLQRCAILKHPLVGMFGTAPADFRIDFALNGEVHRISLATE